MLMYIHLYRKNNITAKSDAHKKKSINEEIICAHRYYTEPANHIFLYYKDHYLAQHSLFLGNEYGYNAFTRDSPPYIV